MVEVHIYKLNIPDSDDKQPADETPGEYTRIRAFVFDIDGTIRRSKSGAKFIKDVDDIELFPDAEARLWQARNEGVFLMALSNQGGVAFGLRTKAQVDAETVRTRELFKEYPFVDYITSYSHPKGTVEPYNFRSLLRKPYYGGLLALEQSAFEHGYIIDWDNSLVVGDRADDHDMAKAAAVPFQWAWDFFDRPRPTDEQYNAALGLKFSDSGSPLCPKCGGNSLATRSMRMASHFLNVADAFQAHIDDGMLCNSCGYIIDPRYPRK